jgi:hypothetical protein
MKEQLQIIVNWFIEAGHAHPKLKLAVVSLAILLTTAWLVKTVIL